MRYTPWEPHTFVALPVSSRAKNGLTRGAGDLVAGLHLKERDWAFVGSNKLNREKLSSSESLVYSSLATSPPTAKEPESLAIPCRVAEVISTIEGLAKSESATLYNALSCAHTVLPAKMARH